MTSSSRKSSSQSPVGKPWKRNLPSASTFAVCSSSSTRAMPDGSTPKCTPCHASRAEALAPGRRARTLAPNPRGLPSAVNPRSSRPSRETSPRTSCSVPTSDSVPRSKCTGVQVGTSPSACATSSASPLPSTRSLKVPSACRSDEESLFHAEDTFRPSVRMRTRDPRRNVTRRHVDPSGEKRERLQVQLDVPFDAPGRTGLRLLRVHRYRGTRVGVRGMSGVHEQVVGDLFLGRRTSRHRARSGRQHPRG